MNLISIFSGCLNSKFSEITPLNFLNISHSSGQQYVTLLDNKINWASANFSECLHNLLNESIRTSFSKPF